MGVSNYSKKVIIYFDAYGLELESVSVLTYEKLRFYEKFIVLALQNGLVAKSIEDLTETMSRVFNMKYSFVDEIIRKLDKLKYIKESKSNGENIYTLSDDFQIKYDSDEKMIMNILSEKLTKDFSNVLYLSKANKFYNKLTFLKYLGSSIDDDEIEKWKKICDKNIAQIIPILEGELKSKTPNLVIDKSANEFEISEVNKYKIAVEVLLHYNYNGKQAILEGYDVDEFFKTELDEYIQAEVEKNYKIDESVPKFIAFSNFYEKSDELDKRIAELNNELEEKQKKIASIEEKITKEIKKKNKKNQEKIENLELDKNALLDEQEIINQKQETVIEELKSVEKETLYCFEKHINDIYIKHKGTTIYDRIVRDICKQIDGFVFDINNNVLDFVSIYFNNTRTNITGLTLSIFNYLTNKKLPKLVSYFDNKFNRIEIENILRKYKLNANDINNMKNFMDIANAFCHSEENTEKRKRNEIIMEDFYKTAKSEKMDIVLSFIKLFGVLDFTKNEKTEIKK